MRIRRGTATVFGVAAMLAAACGVSPTQPTSVAAPAAALTALGAVEGMSALNAAALTAADLRARGWSCRPIPGGTGCVPPNQVVPSAALPPEDRPAVVVVLAFDANGAFVGPATMVRAAIAAVPTSGSMVSSHNARLNQSLATSGGDKTIVGTWRTHVRPRNCETDEVAPVGLRGLFSFHEGGTLSEYVIGPGLTPALRSPGHGEWQRLPGWDEDTYAFTFYRYDAIGTLIGSTRVSSALRLVQGGDAFSSNSEVEVLDANEGLLMTACARADGTRFK